MIVSVSLAARLEAVETRGYTMARIARLAEVSARRLYESQLSPDERLSIESVLQSIESGKIAPKTRGRTSVSA